MKVNRQSTIIISRRSLPHPAMPNPLHRRSALVRGQTKDCRALQIRVRPAPQYPYGEHQVTNWPDYDAALVRRGSLTPWVTEQPWRHGMLRLDCALEAGQLGPRELTW
jgi:hypothetical protein